MFTADIVEIDIDTAIIPIGLGRAAHRVEQVAAGLVVDGMVDAARPQPVALGIGACGRNDGAAHDLGDLRHHRSDRAGTARHEHRLARLGPADFAQAGIAGQSRHPEHAQKRLIGHAGLTRQFFQRRSGCHKGLAPAEHRRDQIARCKAFGTRGNDFTDGTALQHRTDLERRYIAGPIIHAAAHIGINRHETVAHQHFAGAGAADIDRGEFEIRRVGGAGGAGFEADFTRFGHLRVPWRQWAAALV